MSSGGGVGGGYRGNHYDPNHRQKRDSQHASVPRSKYDQTSAMTPRSNDGNGRSYGPDGYTPSQPRSQLQPQQSIPYQQESQWDGYDGYSLHTNQINSAPPPSTLPISVPTGPASARSSPLPLKPNGYGTYPSTSVSNFHPTGLEPNGTRTPRTSRYDVDVEVPDRRKEDGEVISSFSHSSPLSAKIHPSRLGLIPHLNPVNGSVPNGSTTSSVTQSEVPASGRFSQGPADSLQRDTRPAPLNFTPIGPTSYTGINRDTGPGAGVGAGPISSTSTPTSSQVQSQSQSTANKSPLDSLEKLRRFKEQVAASRKPNSAYTGPEMSQIAQMAAKFLESQDVDTSDRAFEQLKHFTGVSETAETGEKDQDREEATNPTERGEGVKSVLGDGATATVTAPVRSGAIPEISLSRQAELKERLWALKSGKGSVTASSSRAPPTAGSNSTPASPNRPNGPITGSVSGSGFKRPPSESGQVEEDTEQKRFRAAAWQRANEQERQDQQKKAEAAAAAAPATQSRDGPRPSASANVRRDDMESSSANSRGITPPRGPREYGDVRHVPGTLQDRLGGRQQQPSVNGYGNGNGYQDRFGTRIQREPESPANSNPRYGSRLGRQPEGMGRNSHLRSPDGRYDRRPSINYGNGRRDVSGPQYRDRTSGHGDTRPTDPRYSDWADPRRMAKEEPDHRSGQGYGDRYARVPPPNPPREVRYSEDRPRGPTEGYRDYPREEVAGGRSYPLSVSNLPSRPPPPRSPSRTRDDYRRHPELPLPLPVPMQMPMALPMVPQLQSVPMVDPATVHATLDILKAQIARLEAMLPAIPPSQPTYLYDPYRTTPGPAPGSIPAPVAALPVPVSMPIQASPQSSNSVLPPAASGYRLEWDERRREYTYVYEPRRADSPPPPTTAPAPPLEPRGYRFEPEPHRGPPLGPGGPPPRPSDREREREHEHEHDHDHDHERARIRGRSPPPHQHQHPHPPQRIPSGSVSANHPSRDLQDRIEPTRRPRAPSSSYSRNEYKPHPYTHPPKERGHKSYGEGRGGRGRGGGRGGSSRCRGGGGNGASERNGGRGGYR